METDLGALAPLIENTRREWKRARVIEGVLLFAALFLGTLVLAFVTDNVLHLPGVVRVILLVAFGAFWVALFAGRVVRPLSERMSNEAVAVAIERKYPDLDNRLINAIQLSGDDLDAFGRFFAKKVASEAAERSADCDVEKVVERGRLWKFVYYAAAAALVTVVYLGFFPEYFANAARRYALVGGNVAPVTSTHLAVEPGDAEVDLGGSLLVRACASGAAPTGAAITLLGAEDATFEMQFHGEDFTYTVENITTSFAYRVCAGDARSGRFQVRVIPRPVIAEMRMKLNYPAYMGRAPDVIEHASGDIEAPKGSLVEIEAAASKELAEAVYLGEGRRTGLPVEGRRFAVKVRVTANASYGFYLKDTEGRDTPEPIRYSITVIPDRAPGVEITAPARDVTISGPRDIVVNFRATDDFNVRRAELVVIKPGGGEDVVKTWEDFLAPAAKVVQGGTWRPASAKPGDEFIYFVRVTDGHPDPSHTAASRRWRVSVVEPGKRQDEMIRELTRLRDRLLKLIKLQKNAKEGAEKLLPVVRDNRRFKKASQDYRRVKGRQSRVLADTKSIAASIGMNGGPAAEARKELTALSASEMPRAVKILDSIGRTADGNERADAARSLVDLQGGIIARLSKLIAPIEILASRLEKAVEAGEELADEAFASADTRAAVREVKKKLEEFIARQKEVIETSRELEKKEVDDYTEEENRKLEEITSIEKALGKFLEDMKDDLAQIPEQDLTDSNMVAEFVEIFSEVEKAADALTRKEVEIAVPHEDSGLELAEELENNLEKWLQDTADVKKWVMEDPTEDVEVPLCDLPDELEDIIGELMAEEEDLNEDAEDLSSKWMDSLDEGAGWETSDGPISNMSAKGVTGNQLPNSHEVGGRSGEGRTGKSHGQHVEETATGKGGRRTPTRVTPDPYEKGQVKDTSTDDPGGATGGGKLSGGGETGLRGQVPPELKKDLKRMSGKQADIRQKAERLDHGLTRRRYPTGDLGRIIVLMKEQEDALKRGDLPAFQKNQKVLIKALEETEQVVRAEIEARREKAAAIPKYLREELSNPNRKSAPPKYRKLVGDYYRALAGEEKEKKK